MALTPEQKSSRLFKKSFGAAESLVTRDFFEEAKLGKSAILPSQIWAEADKIPNTAPAGMTNGQTVGVVQRFIKLSLTHISGSGDDSYYHESLKNAIPFNFGDGSYNYNLYKSDGTTVIPFGQFDWLLDTDAGVLTFYNTSQTVATASNPPQISFFKYVGEFGIPSGATSGLNVHTPVRLASAASENVLNYSPSLSGFTSLPISIDGVTALNEGDRILLKDQTNLIENGVFVVSGTTLVRAADSNGDPLGEVSIGDYVFVSSGNTNIANGYTLSNTNAAETGKIVVGVDTQVWSIFSASKSYTANELAIKLNGSEFGLSLNPSGNTYYGSGLYQSIDGLSISNAIGNDLHSALTAVTVLSGNTTSLSTALSVAISTMNSADTSLSTALSAEISNRSQADSSILTVINNLSGVTNETAGSGLTFNSANTSLNVAVDNYTIKIIGDEIRGSQLWMQTNSTTVIASGTTGATNITITYDPITPIQAYVNGVEYLVNPTPGNSAANMPFYFLTLPTVGAVLYFDAAVADFDLALGDLITIKYQYIDNN